MVSAAENYAFEIEIFTFGRGLRTQILRSSVQKRCFNQSMTWLFGRTDVFNRIGRFLTFAMGINRPKAVSEQSDFSVAIPNYLDGLH